MKPAFNDIEHILFALKLGLNANRTKYFKGKIKVPES